MSVEMDHDGVKVVIDSELPLEVRVDLQPRCVEMVSAVPTRVVGFRLAVEVTVRIGEDRMTAGDAKEVESAAKAVALIEPIIQQLEFRIRKALKGMQE